MPVELCKDLKVFKEGEFFFTCERSLEIRFSKDFKEGVMSEIRPEELTFL